MTEELSTVIYKQLQVIREKVKYMEQGVWERGECYPQ